MTLTQKRRIEKIERALKINKGKTIPFPDGKGGFIELPYPMNFIDLVAMLGGLGKNKTKVNETERFGKKYDRTSNADNKTGKSNTDTAFSQKLRAGLQKSEDFKDDILRLDAGQGLCR